MSARVEYNEMMHAVGPLYTLLGIPEPEPAHLWSSLGDVLALNSLPWPTEDAAEIGHFIEMMTARLEAVMAQYGAARELQRALVTLQERYNAGPLSVGQCRLALWDMEAIVHANLKQHNARLRK